MAAAKVDVHSAGYVAACIIFGLQGLATSFLGLFGCATENTVALEGARLTLIAENLVLIAFGATILIHAPWLAIHVGRLIDSTSEGLPFSIEKNDLTLLSHRENYRFVPFLDTDKPTLLLAAYPRLCSAFGAALIVMGLVGFLSVAAVNSYAVQLEAKHFTENTKRLRLSKVGILSDDEAEPLL